MTIKTEEIVTYAREMLQAGSNCSEIELRNIINRSYYGAFLTARDKVGVDSQSGSVHGEVIDYFKKPNGKSRIANNLIFLKSKRHKADYEPHIDIQLQDAKDCVNRAYKVLVDLSE